MGLPESGTISNAVIAAIHFSDDLTINNTKQANR
jgi:hypothetical protein